MLNNIYLLLLIIFFSACNYTTRSGDRVKVKMISGSEIEVERRYSPDDVLLEEATLLDGMRHGSYKRYFPNGSIQDDQYYKSNLLDGVSKKYYKNGNLQKEENYIEGKMIFLFLNYLQ